MEILGLIIGVLIAWFVLWTDEKYRFKKDIKIRDNVDKQMQKCEDEEVERIINREAERMAGEYFRDEMIAMYPFPKPYYIYHSESAKWKGDSIEIATKKKYSELIK